MAFDDQLRKCAPAIGSRGPAEYPSTGEAPSQSTSHAGSGAGSQAGSQTLSRRSGGGGGGGRGGSGGGAPLLFRNWDLPRLQAACVLAGCDFLPSLKGIGFKKAHGLMDRHRLLNRVRVVAACWACSLKP